MRRGTSVLGAVLALTLAAQPAWAESPSQERHVGSQTASAPVRVASDGGGGTSSSNPADGGQTAASPEGATQVGSVGVEVPVGVLSDDGSFPDTTGGDDGAEVVDEVTDVGVGVLTEVLGRGTREAAAATGSTTDGTATAPLRGVRRRSLKTSAAALRGAAPGAAHSSTPGAGETGDTAVLRGDGGDSRPSGAGLVPAALVDVAGSLPLTGIPGWLLIAAGVWLLLSGLALLFALTLLKAPGRRIDPGDAALPATRRFVR